MDPGTPAVKAQPAPEDSPFTGSDVAIVLLLSILVPAIAGIFVEDVTAVTVFVLLLPSQWVGNAIGLLFIKWRRRAEEVHFGLPILGRDFGGIGLGILTFVAILTVLGPIAERLGLDETAQVTVAQFTDIQSPWVLAVAIINIAVLAPLMEELTYRGVLHGALRKRLGPRATVGLGALIFALVHIPGIDPGTTKFWLVALFTVVEVFLLTLVLAGLREKDGRIGRAFFAHGAWNAVNLIAILSLPYLETGA